MRGFSWSFHYTTKEQNFCYDRVMHLLLFNFSWMTFNIILALIAVLLGFVALKAKNSYLRVLMAVTWLIFLPNTIYLFTDLLNLIHQWGILDPYLIPILVLQYVILQVFGFITFVLALYPFEKFLKRSRFEKGKSTIYVVLLNSVVAFGITLGRVERINSWEVLQNPLKVVNAGFHVISSASLLELTLLFAIFSNISYFLLRKSILKYFNTYLARAGV
jgi:uncharacterized membrane protein